MINTTVPYMYNYVCIQGNEKNLSRSNSRNCNGRVQTFSVTSYFNLSFREGSVGPGLVEVCHGHALMTTIQ